MLNLLRLGRIIGDSDLEDKAEKIGRAFSKNVNTSPMAHTGLLAAVDFGVGPSFEVVIVGNSKSDDTTKMLRAVQKQYTPNKVVIFRPTEKESPEIDNFSEFTKHFESIDGKATAYVCVDYSCKFPTTDTEKLMELLNK